MARKAVTHNAAARRALAEAYRQVAVEHLERLIRSRVDGRDPAMTIYLAGLAVECMFRAYRCLIDPEFDARHHLDTLAERSQFAAHVSPDATPEYAVRLGRLAQVWSSNHRYVSIAVLTRRLRTAGYRPKSNTLGHVAGILYGDAQWLMAIDLEKWT